MVRPGKIALGASLLLTLVLPGTVLAASGDVDNSFSDDGMASLAPMTDVRSVTARNGKVVLVGEEQSAGDAMVARLDSAGDPDTGFGGPDGMVTIDIGTGNEAAVFGHIMSNNKILVVGYSGTSVEDGFLLRLKANGTLDNNFAGGDGMFKGEFGVPGGVAFYHLVVMASGKIYVTGEAYPDPGTCVMGLWRFNANGTPDTSFSGDGMATLPARSECDGGWRILPLANGDVIVGGWSAVPDNDYDLIVARFNSNGTVDTGFGLNGAVTYNPTQGGNEWVTGLAVVNNRLVVGVHGASTANGDIGILRLEMNGALDQTFGGGDGKVIVDLGGDEIVNGMAVSNGKLLMGGTRDGQFFAARLNMNGALDTTFDGDGWNTIGINGNVDDLAVQPNGKILVAGSSSGHGVVARFLP